MHYLILADFANTPAGYLSGGLLPVLAAAGLGWLAATSKTRKAVKENAEKRLRTIEDALLRLTTIVEHQEGKDDEPNQRR